MKLSIVAAVVVAALLSSVSAEAYRGVLKGKDLKLIVPGSRISINTPLGSLPITYRADGTMTGKSRRLARYTGSVRDSGKWWIRRNKLCQRWNRWLNGKRQCFTLKLRGKVVYWRRNDGQKGTARLTRVATR